VARNRASMREGPLAELFRATEAAQRQRSAQNEQQELVPEPPVSPAPAVSKQDASKQHASKPSAAKRPVPAARAEKPTPIRAVAPAPDPEPEPAEERRPLARWLDPLPEQPARLERARDSAS
jgi:hypothetical protein